MTEKLLVPDIGDFENVEVIEILVKEGQEIEKNDPVVTIESDKSSVEVPSIFSGKVDSINVKVGDKVSKGDLLINISNKEKISDLTKEVPKNTENLIKEAEKSLELDKDQRLKKLKMKNLKFSFQKMEILIH
jgi:pyruvate dehydrogenase E1 component